MAERGEKSKKRNDRQKKQKKKTEEKNRKIKRKSKEKEAEKIDDARLIWYNIPKIIITYNITIKE